MRRLMRIIPKAKTNLNNKTYQSRLAITRRIGKLSK